MAVEHFMKARDKYHVWGAAAKCNALFDFVKETFGSAPCLDDSKSPAETSTLHQGDHDNAAGKRPSAYS